MKRRILLVDDDVAVLLTLKAVLEMNQFEVETASSGAEAMKKMRSGIYQMVITEPAWKPKMPDSTYCARHAGRNTIPQQPC